MSFSSRLKEWREHLGLSRSEVAAKLGVTASAVGNYENGVSIPKEEVLYKIFYTLGAEPNYLWQDEMLGQQSHFMVSFDEQSIIKKYRSLDVHGRKIVDYVLDEEYERVKSEPANVHVAWQAHNGKKNMAVARSGDRMEVVQVSPEEEEAALPPNSDDI